MLNRLRNLGDILPFAAEAHGDKTALIFQEKSFTFKELDQLSNKLANSLRAMDILPGDRVSIYSNN